MCKGDRNPDEWFLVECEDHYTKIINRLGEEDSLCPLQRGAWCSYKIIGNIRYVAESLTLTWTDEKPDDADEWLKRAKIEKIDVENVLILNEKMKRIIGKYLKMNLPPTTLPHLLSVDVLLPQHFLE